MNAWRTMGLTLCVLATASLAFAQGGPQRPRWGGGPPPGPGAPGDIEDRDTSELLEAVMAARLAKALGLNDEQTVVTVRRFGEYKEELRGLRRRRHELLKQLTVAVHDEVPEAEIDTALKNLVEHDTKLAKYKFGAFQKASENLSVTQRAKLYVFLNEFESDMRGLIQRARERGGRSGPRFREEGPPEYQGEEGAAPRFRRGQQGGPGLRGGPGPRAGRSPMWGRPDDQPPPPPDEGSEPAE